MIKFLRFTVLIALVLCYSCDNDDDAISNANNATDDITAFNFFAIANEGISEDIVASIEGSNVNLTVPLGTEINALVATVSLAEGATITPDPTQPQDYTEPITYTIRTADGSTRQYTVTVNVSSTSNGLLDIQEFVFKAEDNTALTQDIAGSIADTDIFVYLPFLTFDRTQLTAAITLPEGATIRPNPSEVQDYSQTVTFTVTASDGSTKDFVVQVLDEEAILTELYTSNTDNRLFWDIENTNPSEWRGVEITNGRVTELRLSAAFLNELPKSIGYLANLESLSVVNNNLNSIPESVENLASLTFLDVSQNKISNLPASLANLNTLKSLLLGNNQFASVPEALRSLTTLENLILNNNQFTSLPNWIVDMVNLKTLNVSNNNFSGLPESMDKLTNLLSLELANTNLTSIPEFVESLTKLQLLDVKSNQIAGAVPEFITTLTELQVLNLRDNQIISLPASIGNLAKLRRLTLTNNNIATLPSSIVNLSELDALYATGNSILALPQNVCVFIDSLQEATLDQGIQCFSS